MLSAHPLPLPLPVLMVVGMVLTVDAASNTVSGAAVTSTMTTPDIAQNYTELVRTTIWSPTNNLQSTSRPHVENIILSVNHSSTNITKSVTAYVGNISGTLKPASLNISGTLKPASLNISGTLKPAALNISGTLKPASLNISGTLKPAALNISGTLKPASLNISGTLKTAALNISGTLKPAALNISGTLKPAALNISGTLKPASLNISNTLKPASLNISGTLKPASLNISGTLKPASLNISGTLKPASLNISGKAKLKSRHKTNNSKKVSGNKNIKKKLAPVKKSFTTKQVALHKRVSSKLAHLKKNSTSHQSHLNNGNAELLSINNNVTTQQVSRNNNVTSKRVTLNKHVIATPKQTNKSVKVQKHVHGKRVPLNKRVNSKQPQNKDHRRVASKQVFINKNDTTEPDSIIKLVNGTVPAGLNSPNKTEKQTIINKRTEVGLVSLSNVNGSAASKVTSLGKTMKTKSVSIVIHITDKSALTNISDKMNSISVNISTTIIPTFRHTNVSVDVEPVYDNISSTIKTAPQNISAVIKPDLLNISTTVKLRYPNITITTEPLYQNISTTAELVFLNRTAATQETLINISSTTDPCHRNISGINNSTVLNVTATIDKHSLNISSNFELNCQKLSTVMSHAENVTSTIMLHPLTKRGLLELKYLNISTKVNSQTSNTRTTPVKHSLDIVTTTDTNSFEENINTKPILMNTVTTNKPQPQVLSSTLPLLLAGTSTTTKSFDLNTHRSIANDSLDLKAKQNTASEPHARTITSLENSTVNVYNANYSTKSRHIDSTVTSVRTKIQATPYKHNHLIRIKYLPLPGKNNNIFATLTHNKIKLTSPRAPSTTVIVSTTPVTRSYTPDTSTTSTEISTNDNVSQASEHPSVVDITNTTVSDQSSTTSTHRMPSLHNKLMKAGRLIHLRKASTTSTSYNTNSALYYHPSRKYSIPKAPVFIERPKGAPLVHIRRDLKNNASLITSSILKNSTKAVTLIHVKHITTTPFNSNISKVTRKVVFHNTNVSTPRALRPFIAISPYFYSKRTNSISVPISNTKLSARHSKRTTTISKVSATGTIKKSMPQQHGAHNKRDSSNKMPSSNRSARNEEHSVSSILKALYKSNKHEALKNYVYSNTALSASPDSTASLNNFFNPVSKFPSVGLLYLRKQNASTINELVNSIAMSISTPQYKDFFRNIAKPTNRKVYKTIMSEVLNKHPTSEISHQIHTTKTFAHRSFRNHTFISTHFDKPMNLSDIEISTAVSDVSIDSDNTELLYTNMSTNFTPNNHSTSVPPTLIPFIKRIRIKYPNSYHFNPIHNPAQLNGYRYLTASSSVPITGTTRYHLENIVNVLPLEQTKYTTSGAVHAVNSVNITPIEQVYKSTLFSIPIKHNTFSQLKSSKKNHLSSRKLIRNHTVTVPRFHVSGSFSRDLAKHPRKSLPKTTFQNPAKKTHFKYFTIVPTSQSEINTNNKVLHKQRIGNSKQKANDIRRISTVVCPNNKSIASLSTYASRMAATRPPTDRIASVATLSSFINKQHVSMAINKGHKKYTKVPMLHSKNKMISHKSSLSRNFSKKKRPVVFASDLYVPGFVTPHGLLCPDMGSHVLLLVLVSSPHAHRAERDAIRLTWGHYAARNDVTLAFFLGASSSGRSSSLREEDLIYGDIIQGSYIDSPSNITLKTISMLEWLTAYCPRAQHLLKTTDDVFINIPQMLEFAAEHNASRTIWGRVMPDRVQYPVSRLQDPHRAALEYVAGPAYLVAGAAVPALYGAALAGGQPYTRLEALYVTGVLAARLGLTRTHVSHFFNHHATPHPCAVRRALCVHSVSAHKQFHFWQQMHSDALHCDGVFYAP